MSHEQGKFRGMVYRRSLSMGESYTLDAASVRPAERRMIMELKPCPFCGSTDVYISFRYPLLGEGLRMLVVCNCCGCMTAQCRNEDKAVEAWNRRSDNEAD